MGQVKAAITPLEPPFYLVGPAVSESMGRSNVRTVESLVVALEGIVMV